MKCKIFYLLLLKKKNVCVFANTLKISIEELEKEFLKQKLKFKKDQCLLLFV